MANALFRAKVVWDSGDRQGGLAMLEEYLEGKIGEVVFEPEPRIFFPSGPSDLEGGVYSMMNAPTMLKAPFGSVFAEIWRMDPHRQWLGLLVQHSFTDPLDFDEFEDLDLPPLDFAFPAIVDVLTDSARRGLLAPDFEGPNNGRPVFRIEEIQGVPDERWGELKPLLLNALPDAYAACPPDFWDRLSQEDAQGVLTRFLHDLFLDHRPPLDAADARWRVIVEQQPGYARAVQRSLANVLESDSSTEDLTEIVRVDAGRLVDDGRDWLERLRRGLAERNLRSLPGQPWPQVAEV